MNKPNLKKAHPITRRDAIWIIPAIGAAGFFGWLTWRGIQINFFKRGVGEATWREAPKAKAALLSELPKAWSFKYFDYPYQGAVLKAVVVRMPQAAVGGLSVGEAHFLALSRVCTHQGCIVNYVDNPELGSIAYNYRTDHPFLGCPCHFGAYEPLRSGEAMFGPPKFPLPRLRLEAEGEALWVTAYETPLRPLESG